MPHGIHSGKAKSPARAFGISAKRNGQRSDVSKDDGPSGAAHLSRLARTRTSGWRRWSVDATFGETWISRFRDRWFSGSIRCARD